LLERHDEDLASSGSVYQSAFSRTREPVEVKFVQATGTGTANKGAELLLIAIQQHLRQVAPEVELAVTSDFGPFEDRARYGLRTVLPEAPKGRWWLAGKMMPAAFRRTCGVVRETDVSAVLDASGFAFGDQLGADRVQRFAEEVRRWKRQGKPVILLPQALGPFENPAVRHAFQDVLDHADLVYARDDISHGHARRLNHKDKLRLAPDFTNLVSTPNCLFSPKPEFGSLVVPNHRMLEKTDKATGEAYIPFLGRCFDELEALQLKPAILLHDDDVDHQLVKPLCKQLGHEVPVITDRDPLRLKSLLGKARVVIGSRFHALVSALSQGVPSIAAGWSHKYEMLLRDYGCENRVLSVDSNSDLIRETIQSVSWNWRKCHEQLSERAATQRERVCKMWKEVTPLLVS